MTRAARLCAALLFAACSRGAPEAAAPIDVAAPIAADAPIASAAPRASAAPTPSAAAPKKASAAPKVVCYVESMTGGAPASALDLSVCTHVIEAFLLVEPGGALRPANGLPRAEILGPAHQRGVPVLLAVGGATVPGATFSAIAATGAARAAFSAAVAEFAAASGYDGVDLDWEFPTAKEGPAHVALIESLRTALDAAFRKRNRKVAGLIAAGVTPGAHLESYDFPGLGRAADLVIHFGYDFKNPAVGPWAHEAKLWPDGAAKPIEASVRGAASEIVRRGVPREKLVIGLPLYGSDGRPWAALRELARASQASLHPLWLEKQIDSAWVTDPEALAAKAGKALFGSDVDGGSAGGIALWQLGHQGAGRDLTDAVRAAVAAGR